MSSFQKRDAIKGSIAIGKGEQGIQGVKGDKGDKGDNNVCIGLSPTSEAEIWFDTNDGISVEEIATKKFVEERTVKLETSLDNLESEVNELKEGNINIDLTNYATKTELSKKLDKSELNGAINTALESAKNSGEFKGQDGYTPIKGIDYFTETDKGELLEAILQSLPTWEGGSY